MTDSWTWAVVTQADPLRVRLEHDTDPLNLTPDSLVGGVVVGRRVWVQMTGGRVIVHGVAGGSEWPGELRPQAGPTVPPGWVLCDGAAVSRTGGYAALFAEIGTTWGAGNGTTTFNLPNLKGRVLVGRDASQAEFDTLGETGGAKTHQHGVSAAWAMIRAFTGNNNLLARSKTADSYSPTVQATFAANSVAGSGTSTTGTELGGATDSGSSLSPYAVGNWRIKL